jgi:protein gp37
MVSIEPLLEDIADHINLDGYGWIAVGGESGAGDEYVWNPAGDWRAEFNQGGRRTMRPEWAVKLRDLAKSRGVKFHFKQVTHPWAGYGANALDGVEHHEFPDPPEGYEWAPLKPTPKECLMTRAEWKRWTVQDTHSGGGRQ